MIKSFESLSGQKLEDWLLDFIKNNLKFADYYPSGGQIRLVDIDPSQSPGEHLEIDGVLLINKTCVFLEITSENSGFKTKLKKFGKNCTLFLESDKLSKKDKFKLFKVPKDRLEDFDEIENFKFVFINTNANFQNENISRNDIPEYPKIKNSLFIIKPNSLEYLRQLTNLIGSYARNELLAVLDFTSKEYGELDETLNLNFIKAGNKFITAGTEVKADVYLLKFTVAQLLRVARVSRYEGIPFIFEDDNQQNYQRLLIENKLENISKKFIMDDKRKLFPNTLTLVLNSECIEESGKLSIPKKFGSIDIIDGQHRLYGYTKNNIKSETLDNSEILATAIKFKEQKQKTVTKNSAKVFVEINSNQAKVKNNLIYLIKYDVLGETDDAALAGKIILLCNSEPETKALGNIFLTNTLNKKNKLNMPCVPITTIVDSDLIPFIKGLKINKKPISEATYTKIFGNDKKYFNTNHLELCTKMKSILQEYFNYVKTVFKKDWEKDANTHLISSKYISAFIRFLRYKMFDENVSLSDMKKELEDLKKAVELISKPKLSPAFPKGNIKIPTTKHGINTIFEFLKDTKSFT